MRTSLILRRTAVAALMITLAAPALAGRGDRSWGHRGDWGGRHGHHGHHHHGGHSSSSDGWWIGGALALLATGLVLASANDEPDYASPGTYSYPYGDQGYGYAAPVDPPVTYAVTPDAYNPPASVDRPSQQGYAHPPQTYASPPQAYDAAPRAYGAEPQGQRQAPQAASHAGDRAQCHRQAVNYSGYDPASPSAWTTAVAVDSYNRALQGCLGAG